MDKCLKKAIMKRTRLLNTYRKTKCSADLDAYRDQRNLVTKMNRKAKLTHFNRAVKFSQSDSKALQTVLFKYECFRT